MKTEADFLTSSSILLDANFLIDANSKPKLFGELIFDLKSRDVTFVAIDFVKTEFVRTKSKIDLVTKLDYFSRVVDAILPIDRSTESLIPGVIEDYGDYLTGVSSVDLYLAATLKRYRSLYLLTGNHKDFPTVIFDRFCPVNFELTNAIKTYAFYQYKSDNKKIVVASEDIPF